MPGVIGAVGSVLGDAGVNIGEYHQARLQAGGEALAAISVDGVMDRQVIQRLAEMADVNRVWQIELPDATPAEDVSSVTEEVGERTP